MIGDHGVLSRRYYLMELSVLSDQNGISMAEAHECLSKVLREAIEEVLRVEDGELTGRVLHDNTIKAPLVGTPFDPACQA